MARIRFKTDYGCSIGFTIATAGLTRAARLQAHHSTSRGWWPGIRGPVAKREYCRTGRSPRSTCAWCTDMEAVDTLAKLQDRTLSRQGFPDMKSNHLSGRLQPETKTDPTAS